MGSICETPFCVLREREREEEMLFLRCRDKLVPRNKNEFKKSFFWFLFLSHSTVPFHLFFGGGGKRGEGGEHNFFCHIDEVAAETSRKSEILKKGDSQPFPASWRESTDP